MNVCFHKTKNFKRCTCILGLQGEFDLPGQVCSQAQADREAVAPLDAAHHAHHDHLPHHLVCQVSLGVKLAHKLKLTEKQLLRWMLPITLIMIIYLTTWSVR
jgi:hypothetical protein